MAPAVVHTAHEAPKHDDCLGTILCMLSCKDGYKLGPKQETGCQSCSCVKKLNTDNMPSKIVVGN